MKVLDTPPFELTETGWGEFELFVKVQFIDPSERTVSFYHRLQLFPARELQAIANNGLSSATTSSSSSGSGNRSPVTSEHYDEIMFSEPSEELYNALRNNMDKLQIPDVGEYSLQAEEDEIRMLDNVLFKIVSETEQHRHAIMAAEQTLRNLQAEIKQLEGSA